MFFCMFPFSISLFYTYIFFFLLFFMGIEKIIIITYKLLVLLLKEEMGLVGLEKNIKIAYLR